MAGIKSVTAPQSEPPIFKAPIVAKKWFAQRIYHNGFIIQGGSALMPKVASLTNDLKAGN